MRNPSKSALSCYYGVRTTKLGATAEERSNSPRYRGHPQVMSFPGGTMRNTKKNFTKTQFHLMPSNHGTMTWQFDIMTGRIHDSVIHLPSSLTPNDTNLYFPSGTHGTPSAYHQKYKYT